MRVYSPFGAGYPKRPNSGYTLGNIHTFNLRSVTVGKGQAPHGFKYPKYVPVWILSMPPLQNMVQTAYCISTTTQKLFSYGPEHAWIALVLVQS